MKPDQFNKIVKARTDELVDKKLSNFTDTVYKAVRDLLGVGYFPMTELGILDEEAKGLLGIVSRNRKDQKWPRNLWEREESQVTKALLKTFDEFTQAKLAADTGKEPKHKMEDEKKPEVDNLESEDDDSPF